MSTTDGNMHQLEAIKKSQKTLTLGLQWNNILSCSSDWMCYLSLRTSVFLSLLQQKTSDWSVTVCIFHIVHAFLVRSVNTYWVLIFGTDFRGKT